MDNQSVGSTLTKNELLNYTEWMKANLISGADLDWMHRLANTALLYFNLKEELQLIVGRHS